MKFWDKKEIELLKRYYPKIGNRDLVKVFRSHDKIRNYKSILEKAKRLKIKKVSYKKEIDKILVQSYSNSSFDILLKNVKKYVPTTNKIALIARANRLGLQRRDYANTMAQKDIEVPHNPSEELAWFLGALAGDGYVSPPKNKWRTYRVRLFVTSFSFAKKFGNTGKKLFGLNFTMKKYKSYKLSAPNKKWKDRYACSFLSKKLVKFLGDWKENYWHINLANKFSWVLSKPAYVSAFIASYFDSDGTVISKPKKHKHRISFAVRNPEVQETVIKLLKILGVGTFSKHWHGVEVNSKEDVKKLANYLKSCIPYKENSLAHLRRL